MEHILLPDFPGIPTVFCESGLSSGSASIVEHASDLTVHSPPLLPQAHATKIPATASLVFCSGQIPSREVDNSLAGETTRERTVGFWGLNARREGVDKSAEGADDVRFEIRKSFCRDWRKFWLRLGPL